MDNLSFLERPELKGEVAVLGIPLDLGKDSVGTDKGPLAIKEAGLVNTLEGVGLKVFDLGNIECPEKNTAQIGENSAVKYLGPIIKVAEETAHHVAGEIRLGRKVIALGGDNSISIGSLSGASVALQGDIGVIWIDAHGDINTDETTLSGNIHGMPIASLLGLGNKKLCSIYDESQKLKPENLLFIGLKDLDQAEIDIIRNNKIKSVTMLDIAEQGLKPAFDEIKKLSSKVKNIWVCLDIDSMDEECAPGTPMATKGGLNYRESINLAKYIGKICNVAGMDITELCPAMDKDNKTAKLVVELISCYLGSESNWYTEYMREEIKKREVGSVAAN